ncbi:queuosine precursor transporter [Halolamina sp. CBA1230]|uniref:queuosine precursor transporter n=1 Tax=Halolamina sp. CBA1230 TaxID=1853690 RepID=UPI0009A1446A|nr:queuosine precursor transporter [Halolamina sp. CBA1230]QKY21159.1 queuosine precursor transporter [Halolamina sp. CBA1230]
MSADRRPLPVDRLLLVALFVTALVVAQLTAAKLLSFQLPFSIPVAGSALTLPGAALAYAVTYFASDCYAELYGKRAARELVNVAFLMNFVVLALVWSTIVAPAANPEFASTFSSVLGASTNIVAGSLLAYVASQNWDVIAFHRLKEATDGEKLWLRNIGSTASSQLIDTVIFVGVAFWLLPELGIGAEMGLKLVDGGPAPSVAALIVGQYVLKLAIALIDTPFVYAVVGAVQRRDENDRRLFAS